MTQTAAEVWRNYATQTVPASGVNTPDKAEIRAWGTLMEDLRLAGGSLAYASRALLYADLSATANITANVYADPTAAYNGIYKKVGGTGTGSWSRIGDLPARVVRLTVSGGTANAITATAPETPTEPGNKIYLLVPTASNTAATTIAVNGGSAVAIKNALGSSLAANSLILDSPVLMLWSVDHYQLVVSTQVDATGILADALAYRDAASGYATAAASSASALGNQLHQYDTRALAAAATIPVSLVAVRIVRYATGYPVSFATYVPGTSSGPMAFQDAASNWWELDVSGVGINPYWCGVKNSSGTDDYAALVLTRNIARTANKPVILPPGFGCYYGTTLELARSWERWIPQGMFATFNFTGTGRAISFDGITYNTVGGGAYSCTFGLRDNPILIIGNINCTDLFYYNNCHFSSFWVHGRDCTDAVVRADTLLSGTPTGEASGVRTKVGIRVSDVADQFFGAMTVTPAFGAHISDGAVCDYHYDIEVCEFGAYHVDCIGCTWHPGTVESCTDGGMYFSAGCSKGTLTGIHMEDNGSVGPSTRISGDRFKVTSCTMATTDEVANTAVGLIIDGDDNEVEFCTIDGMTINSGAADNLLHRNDFVGALAITDSGTRTNRDGNIGLSDYIDFTPGLSSSSGTITTVGAKSGKVKYQGDTAFYRIEGTITTNGGTASGVVQLTGLPAAPTEDSIFVGQDVGSSGKCVIGYLGAGLTTMSLRFYDSTYPGADGARFVMQGSCQVST